MAKCNQFMIFKSLHKICSVNYREIFLNLHGKRFILTLINEASLLVRLKEHWSGLTLEKQEDETNRTGVVDSSSERSSRINLGYVKRLIVSSIFFHYTAK